MMKKVISPKLFYWPFFRYHLPPGGIKELLARNPEWINPYSVSLFFIASGLILGFKMRGAWILSFSLTVFLLLNYFFAWYRCRSLFIKRRYPRQAREGDKIDILYTVENSGAFPLWEVTIQDVFSGTLLQKWTFSLEKRLKSGRSRTINQSIVLDNGMGQKYFGDIEVHFSDLLGIFTFRVFFQEEAKLDVLPFVSPFPHSWEQPKEETPHFGMLELDRKGDSTNFVDLREYRQGDALRSVNWMASLRTDKLLVNEFDQLVDSQITLFLNNDVRANSGEGAYSSFEYGRDLALTIAEDQLIKGNMLRLITCDQVHHMGRGNDFYHFLELHLASLSLSSIENRQQNFPSERFFDFVAAGSTLVYLSPIHHLSYLQKDIEVLRQLGQHNRRVIILMINPYPYIYRLIKGQGRITVAGLIEGTKGFYARIEELLLTQGIFVYQVEIDERKTFKSELAKLGLKHLLYQESFK